MNPEELAKALEGSLQKQLPEIVSNVVDAKMAPVTKKFEDLENSMAEFNKVMKGFNYANDGEEKEAKKKAISATGAFFKELKKKGSFDLVGQEIKAAFLNETTDAEGGMMVPNELAKEVVRVAGQFGLARQFCRIFPMGTDTKDITTIVSGVTMYWTAEGSSYTPSKPGLAKVTLLAKKLTAMVGAANELIEDNMTDAEIFTLVASIIGEYLAKFEDEQVLTGDGTGSNFTGVMNLTSANIITMGVGQMTYASLKFSDIISMVDSIDEKYMKNGKAQFYMSKSVWSAIKKIIKITGSNESAGRWTEVFSNGKIERTLYGFPVQICTNFPLTTDGSQTSKKFLCFGDLYYYAFGDRRQLTLDYGYAQGQWEQDIKSLKANERIAGIALFQDAFAVLKTSAT